jgi:hypothetical protein
LIGRIIGSTCIISVTGSEEVVLAELDSVLDSFHTPSGTASGGGGSGNKQQQHPATSMNSSGGSSSGGVSAGKNAKKKRSSKNSSSEHRGSSSQQRQQQNQTEPVASHAFKSPSGGGGTWPRTRGGPIIDQGTGTILHPGAKVKKERLPLSELLNNLPKYPPEKKTSKSERAEVISRTSTRRTTPRPMTTYGMIDTTGKESIYRPLDPTSMIPVSNLGPFSSASIVDQRRAEIDDSVKSAHPGKEALERYLKKTSSSSIKSSSSASNPPSSLTLPQQLGISPSPQLPTLITSSSPSYAALKAAQDMVTRGEQQQLVKTGAGFSPYFPAPQPPGPPLPQQHSSSSPRYSSPPPLVSAASGDSLLGSPIQDFRSAAAAVSSYSALGGGHFDNHNHHHQHHSMSPSAGSGGVRTSI